MPIKLHKSTIASCVLTILLVTQPRAIGLTQPSAPARRARTTCLIGLLLSPLTDLLAYQRKTEERKTKNDANAVDDESGL